MSKKVKLGVYGGCFDPLHIGHVQTIFDACEQCEKIILVLSYNEKRDRIDHNIREQWLRRLIKIHHMNVEIFPIREVSETKEFDDYYKLDDWLNIATKIKEFAKSHIDAVFISESDPKILDIYKKCYPDSDIMLVPKKYKCSSSEIFKNPFKNWEFIHGICKPYFKQKILIIGGECAGKSTMCKKLAEHYDGNFIEEYGKTYYKNKSGILNHYDAYSIVTTHSHLISKVIEEEYEPLVFVDTDALTTHFYLNAPSKAFCIEIIENMYKPDIVIWLSSDNMNFVQDGTRCDDQDERKRLTKNMFNFYKWFYNDKFHIVDSTDYDQRFNDCIKIIDKLCAQ